MAQPKHQQRYRRPEYERDRQLKTGPYSFDLDENGDVVATDFFESMDAWQGRDLIVFDHEARVVRFIFADLFGLDISLELLTCRQCILSYGYWHSGEPPGQWLEFACLRNLDGGVGIWHVPEANAMGTCKFEELVGKEYTLRFYRRKTQIKRRGKNRYPIVKAWECPVRFCAQVEVPYLGVFPDQQRLPEFITLYDTLLKAGSTSGGE